MSAKDLSMYRDEIDAIDDEVVKLLARRFGVAAQVARYKRERGIAVRLQDRIGQVLDRVEQAAKNNGAEPEAIRTIYQTVIETTCRFEEARISNSN